MREFVSTHGMLEGAFYNWKAKFGGMTVSKAKRLKALDDDRPRLRHGTDQ